MNFLKWLTVAFLGAAVGAFVAYLYSNSAVSCTKVLGTWFCGGFGIF